jgi:hypothetical protein
VARNLLGRIAGTAALVCFFLFVFRNYYGPDGLLFEDANYSWTRELLNAALLQFFHAWNPHFGGGMSSIIMNSTSFAPLLLQTSVSFLGVPLSTVLVYPAVMILGFCGAYVLLRELGADRAGAALLALFYVGNPWYLDRTMFGHLAILFAAGVVPWLFWAMRRQRSAAHAYGLLTLALAALELLADVRIAYFAFVGLYLVVAVQLAGAAVRGGRKGFLSAARLPSVWYPALAPFVALAVNAWWTLPFVLYANLNPIHSFYPPLEEVTDFSSHGDLFRDFALSGTWVRYSWTTMAGLGTVAFALWYAAFAVLAATALVAPGASPERRALVAVSIVAGLVLSTGTTYFPVETVYWFYQHVPFAAFFRDPNKFSFIVVLGLVVGVAAAWPRLGPRVKAAVTAATLLICLPLVSGQLHVPLGGGFQTFSERSHFVNLLAFLRRQPGFPAFRIAVIPPWLAEQSLRPGAWYVANPFVFQLEVPVVDAKLISTGTATNQSAWRAFNGLYWGVDRHPAKTFSRLGVRYFVILDQAVISLGAQQSPYYGIDTRRIAAALLADPAIHEVFRDGAYHVYVDDAYVPLVRTAARPLVAGSLSDEVRAALPADELGDGIGQPEGRPAALPPGVAGFGESALDRCLATSSGVTQFAAYAHVSQRADWFHYWSASDYPQQGTADAALDRRLQRFALPFALSKSGRPFDIPIVARARAHVFVEAAGLTGHTLARAALDGGAPVTWAPSGFGFSWHDVGTVTAGKHVVTFTGSTIGTALKSVALAAGPCAAGGIELARSAAGTGRVYFVPGQVSWPAIVRRSGRWTVRDAGTALSVDGRPRQAGAVSSSGPLAPGVLAFGWDDVAVPEGVAFATLSGAHTLAGFSAEGRKLAGTRRSAGGAFAWNFRGVDPGGRMTIELASHSPVSTRVAIAYGERSFEVRLAAHASQSVLASPIGGDGVSVSVVGNPLRAAARALNVTAFRAVERFHATVLVPASAVRIDGGGSVALLPAVAPAVRLRLGRDGASVETVTTPPVAFVDCHAGALDRLRIRGVRASTAEREVVTAYYKTLAGAVEPRAVAEFDAGPAVRDVDLAVPPQPFMASVGFAIRRPDGTVGSLAARSIQFAAGLPDDGGYFVRVPDSAVARAALPVALSAGSDFERFSVARRFDGPLVGGFSYDDYWTYGDAPHLVANGTSNLWATNEPGNGSYRLQPLYLGLLAASGLAWSALIAAICALFVRGRARPQA